MAALLRGVALGGLLVAVAGAVSFVARTVFWRGDHMPEGVNAHVPWLFPVGKIGLALVSTNAAGAVLLRIAFRRTNAAKSDKFDAARLCAVKDRFGHLAR